MARSESSREAVKRVIAAFERSDWSEIDVRFGDVRVHLSAGSDDGLTARSTGPGPAGADAEAVEAGIADGETDAAGSAPPAAPAPPADAPHVIRAPSPGIFWRSPEPGAPPFAEVGDAIEPSATVCIVEVMKLMNHVKAGIGGVVLAVYVENGHGVQKGDPLFGIAPNDEAMPG